MSRANACALEWPLENLLQVISKKFRQKCELMLESYGWKLLDIDRANPAPENYDYNEEVADQLERPESIQMPLFMG